MGMRLSMRAWARGALLTTVLVAVPVRAQTLGQEEVCDPVTKQVDRERLAMAALEKAGVSAYPFRWSTTHPPSGGDANAPSPAQRLLVGDDFCTSDPADEGGIVRCGKDDAEKLGYAADIVIEVLNDQSAYAWPADVNTRQALFAPSSPAVMCRTSVAGTLAKAAPTAIPAPFDQKKIPLRIRGTTDGLQFDRNRDLAFNGVEKAAISFKSDRAAGKDTFKGTVVTAVAAPIIHGVLELVPYVGYQIDTSTKDGQAKEVSDDTIRVGALLDFRSHGNGVSHLFLLRPEYGSNRKERSEIVTATLTYQPLVNGWLNDAYNVTTSGNRSLLSVIPRLDLRMTAGDFVKLGTRAPEESRDFIRVGGQVGVSLVSDVKWLPLELSVTETYLRALQGSPDDLSQLRAIFSIYFDEKKFFGIDLGYVRGRRDDLSKREENWTLGFGAKF